MNYFGQKQEKNYKDVHKAGVYNTFNIRDMNMGNVIHRISTLKLMEDD